jgi:opacity protein-like surface antigen
MKKNILLLLMSFLFFTAAHAQDRESSDEKLFCVDQTNFYAKFLSGVNFLQNTTIDGNKSTFKAGYSIAGSLGYCWSCGLHLEAEYAFRRNAIKKIDFYVEGCSTGGHFQSSSGMANLLWDLSSSSRKCAFWNIQPFIGVGLGYDFQQLHSSNSRIIFDQKWNSLSWQAMAGLTYPILRNMDMTLEYKFHQGGRHFYNHSVGMGLVYKFGF